jgi:hypothetical protein
VVEKTCKNAKNDKNREQKCKNAKMGSAKMGSDHDISFYLIYNQ